MNCSIGLLFLGNVNTHAKVDGRKKAISETVSSVKYPNINSENEIAHTHVKVIEMCYLQTRSTGTEDELHQRNGEHGPEWEPSTTAHVTVPANNVFFVFFYI